MLDRVSQEDLFDWVKRHLGASVTATGEVQSLWSGYGSILRLALDASPGTVIVKQVTPPETASHPRGWAGEVSHERKLRSFAVERAFYEDWYPEATDVHRTATCFAATAQDGQFRLLLEDLDAAGYPERRSSLSPNEMRACLSWLAAFHARHLGRAPDGLWPIGTYWHLATRQDELAVMQDTELRDAAPRVDALLRNCPYQTIVHGDAKVANFCFSTDRASPRVAAVDFQYVGRGCGVQDLAYFLSSCLDDAECEAQAEHHLDTYFAALSEHLPPAVDADALESSWRALYPAAWADFHRFLNGWAPDHWKIHDYTRRMTREALADL